MGPRPLVHILLVACVVAGAGWIAYGFESYDNILLGRMGISEILRFLDGSDQGRSLSEDQIAAKYILGEIPKNENPPARAVLKWKSLKPSDQRQLKVVWFRQHFRQVSIEEVNKYVNIDYIRAQVDVEYRDNPLAIAEQATRDRRELLDRIRLKEKGDFKRTKPPKSRTAPFSPRDTPTKKAVLKAAKKDPSSAQSKTDESPTPAVKVKAPVKRPAPVQANSGDTGDQPPTVGGTIKKLPWFGIPNKMKNE